MLSSTLRLLTRILAVLYAVTGLVLFIAPDWSAANFAWNISPFVAMTMGGWCLGTAVYAWVSARIWRWPVVYPCLIYLWAFGVLETLVVLMHLDRLRLDVIMAWPYLLALLLTVVAFIVGVVDWLRLRPAVNPEGLPVPWWVRVMTVGFVLIVLPLGVIGLLRTTPSTGAIFPDNLSVFTIQAFGAFFSSLTISGALLPFARGLAIIVTYLWCGMGLIIPITAAAFINIGKFDFTAHPDQLIYIGAYLLAFVGAVIILVYARLRSQAPTIARAGAAQ
jgi:hypothetical protein